MPGARRQRWRKMKAGDIPAAEALLKSAERFCMNACARYISRKAQKGEVWTLRGESSEMSALLVHARKGLLPVSRLDGPGAPHSDAPRFPAPHFLRGLFGAGARDIYSLQGREEDALAMEAQMEKIGMLAAEKIDFDLMCIDRQPGGFRAAGPAGLAIRKPRLADMDRLAELRAAYEKEEVLSADRALCAGNERGADRERRLAASRMRMEQIFASEQMLVAELGGQLIGKINTNAAAFTRCQVGGVYVHPDFRGMGIARRMAGEFVAGLVAQGLGISLFVKKSNPAARRVYRNIGFETVGSYRINYYRKG